MPIDSICPGCGRTLRVAVEHAGTEAQCPVCNTVYVVPASSQSELGEQVKASQPKQYFARIPTGAQYGPVSYEVIVSWLQENRINAACFIREEGQENWLPFLEWVQLPGNAIQMVMLPGSLPQPANLAGSSYAFGEIPGAQSSVVQYPIPSRGTLVLILGIVSWVLCITWVGSLVMAAVALGIGYKDLRNIASGATPPSERNLTLIGMWLAGSAMAASCFVIFLLIVAAMNP
jgi:hypothetical protein